METEDFLIAKRLQQQFDKELLEISSGEEDVLVIDSVEQDMQLAVKLQSQFDRETVDLLSDNDDDVILQAVEASSIYENIAKKQKTSVASNAAPKPKLFQSEVAGLNSKEYFIEELQTYVNPEYNFEWKFIDVLPNIEAIFAKFDALYFQSRFKRKQMNIMWSASMGESCTNRNSNNEDGRYTITLNASLLTLRPRIEIISIILHEMIHALLKIEGVKEPNNGHGNNFRKIMIFLNSMLQTNISFNHKLNNTSRICRNEWYRCTGICTNYSPFYGIVRSIEDSPGLQNEWWKDHSDSCGGTFYKIVEMSKMVESEVSTRHAVNVNYMLPKRENIRGRYITNLPPKESIDLTDDIPKVTTMTSHDIVNVDLNDSTETLEHTAVADKFIEHFNRSVAFTRATYEMQCPICQNSVKRKLFGSHIDGCKGFVRNVPWKTKSGGVIVQNGLLELQAKFRPEPSTTNLNPGAPSNSSLVNPSPSFKNYQQIKRKRFG